jgi:hypothetical protein
MLTENKQILEKHTSTRLRFPTHIVKNAGLYVAIFLALFTIIVYYPGYMSPDSVVMLEQARTSVTTNIYSPLMSYIWRFWDKVIPGPGGIMMFHIIVFFAGAAGIARVAIPQIIMRIVFIAGMGLWPPTFAMLGTVWKDVGMAAFLVAATAAILYAGYRRQMRWIGLSFLLLFLACGYRQNAIAAALPMTGLIIIEATKIFRSRRPLQFAWLETRHLVPATYAGAGLTFSFALIIAVHAVNSYGILPNYITKNTGTLTVDELKHMYSPLHANSLYSTEPRLILGVPSPISEKVIRYQLSPADADDLKTAWFVTVLDNPGAYMLHRWRIAERLLVIPPYKPWYPYIRGIDPNPWGLQFFPTALNRTVMRVIEYCAFSTRIYSAWLHYVALAGCFFVSLLWPFPYRVHVNLISASAFLYFISILSFGMSGDYRYNLWPVVASFICIILLLAGKTRSVYSTCDD